MPDMNAAVGPMNASQMLQDLVQQRMMIQDLKHKQDLHQQKLRHAEEKHQNQQMLSQGPSPELLGNIQPQPDPYLGMMMRGEGTDPNMGRELSDQIQKRYGAPSPPQVPAQDSGMSPAIKNILISLLYNSGNSF